MAQKVVQSPQGWINESIPHNLVKKLKKEKTKKNKVSFLMSESVLETIFIALEGESLKKKTKTKKATKKDNSPSKKSMEEKPKVTNNFDINESAENKQEEDIDEEILIKQEPKENEPEKSIEEESNVEIKQDEDEVNPNNQQEARTKDKEVKEHNNKEV